MALSEITPPAVTAPAITPTKTTSPHRASDGGAGINRLGGNNSQCQANRWVWGPDHQVNKLDLLNKLAWGGYRWHLGNSRWHLGNSRWAWEQQPLASGQQPLVTKPGRTSRRR
jgi:hypothetical protein